MTATVDLLARIRNENLGVYRSSPKRLREDVSQEAEIAHDYRGRLVYELLQNADDAMLGTDTPNDRILFRLTETDLWVGNSGRPLDDGDVEGLAGTGISTKAADGPRRASIGHKGMGFKSVLEITDHPSAYSVGHCFRMSAADAFGPVAEVLRAKGEQPPSRVPAMRFPWPVDTEPDEWLDLRRAGVTTLFRFPLRGDLNVEQRRLLRERLQGLPVTSVLFLKHLEQVDIEIATAAGEVRRSLTIEREKRIGGSWRSSVGLASSGTYRVTITSADGQRWVFVLAHDADVSIGANRSGLDSFAWSGIAYTEVSVATPWPVSGPQPPGAWRRFHVFLPTGETLPQPLLVNGAFATDLSRQEIRIGPETDDYNAYLASHAARVIRETLAPAVLELGGPEAVLGMLDRAGASAASDVAASFLSSLREAFRGFAFIPSAAHGKSLAIHEIVVPPTTLSAGRGAAFRALLGDEAGLDAGRFPAAAFCDAPQSRVLVDLGARELTVDEAVTTLGTADPARTRLVPHIALRLRVDPVLVALEDLWRAGNEMERRTIGEVARSAALFPTAADADGYITRAVTKDVACFYPPRSYPGGLPLDRLSFLLRDVCWGELLPRERNDALRDQFVVWQSLFGIREFKFPEVMRAAILPALELTQGPDTVPWRRLQSRQQLAAICQLAGRTPKPNSPLPYQRLGSDRQLINLARLPVPVRRGAPGGPDWLPAFRIYFGKDWIGDESAELVFEAMAQQGIQVPDVAYVAPPEEFMGLLSQFRDIRESSGDDLDDEVSVDEDEDQALEANEIERWRSFLSWLGINRALRPIHFQDVEDLRAGWVRTKDLTKPDGAAFAAIKPSLWAGYRGYVDESSGRLKTDGLTPYFFQLHDLEHSAVVLNAASTDKSGVVATAVFQHIAANWPYLEQYARLEIALVPNQLKPGMRTPPIRPYEHELRTLGNNFWLWRLRRRPIVPTSHGPRAPGKAWLPSAEIERRFGRRGSSAASLVPVVELPGHPTTRARAVNLARILGVREDFTPANFRTSDGAALCERLAKLYPLGAEGGGRGLELDERSLRTVIRPAYRNLFELLVGTIDRGQPDGASLARAPLLETDGAGRYRWRPGAEVLYQDRPGTRERIGAASGLWTFVLEAAPSARAPLARVFGARFLEDAIRWAPNASESHLDGAATEAFRRGLNELRPFVLARLRAERNEDVQARTDARRLDRFIATVEPVEDLRVGASLDGRPLTTGDPKESFVGVDPDGGVTAFVRWGEAGWPPTSRDAEALAAALADLFAVSMFEPFFALINASSREARMRLLQLAGAPTDLDEVLAIADDASIDLPELAIEKTAPGADIDDVPVAPPAQRDGVGRVPLWRVENLMLSGFPVIVRGEPASLDGRRGGGSQEGVQGQSPAYGSQATDLEELDRVGMAVTLAYEAYRLGAPDTLFDPSAPSTAARVFDVSSPDRLAVALKASAVLRQAFDALVASGVSREWPGFDIVTLDGSKAERLIELKSSGVNANVQSMSWNEWKTARDSTLRDRFWLYLVGNLRSDLADARPFVRAICDPFGSLMSTVVTAPIRRAVQLDVKRFEKAEYQELGIRTNSADEEAKL